MAVSVLFLFIVVSMIGFWSVIMAFPGHGDLLVNNLDTRYDNTHCCYFFLIWETISYLSICTTFHEGFTFSCQYYHQFTVQPAKSDSDIVFIYKVISDL